METPHLLPRSLSINVRFQLRHFPLLGQSESHSAALGWLSGAMDLALLFGVATIRAREGGVDSSLLTQWVSSCALNMTGIHFTVGIPINMKDLAYSIGSSFKREG